MNLNKKDWLNLNLIYSQEILNVEFACKHINLMTTLSNYLAMNHTIFMSTVSLLGSKSMLIAQFAEKTFQNKKKVLTLII